MTGIKNDTGKLRWDLIPKDIEANRPDRKR